MKEETTRKVLLPFKSTFLDKKTEELYKIIQKSNLNNKLLDETKKLLYFIDSSKIQCSGSLGRNTVELLSKALEISEKRARVIFSFLLGEELVVINSGILEVTSCGRIFLMSDSISSSVDMIRYFWEKYNWQDIAPQAQATKFTHEDARRYIACLLSQVDNGPVCDEEQYESYKQAGLAYYDNRQAILEMLLDPSVGSIIDTVFEPLGLVGLKGSGKGLKVNITECGRRVFEYYSFNMFEEYCHLIEEGWESYDRGNFQEAYDIAMSVIRVAGNMPEAFNIIGCIHIKRKEYENAENVFRYAMELCERKIPGIDGRVGAMETYISIYYNLGLCQYYMGQYIKALHIFNAIKKTVPYSMESVDNISTTIKKLIVK